MQWPHSIYGFFMDKFKDFQAKNIDQAILAACEYFDSPREQLEIEIVQDAKSGIFGIVGARKAKIRARRAHVQETVDRLLTATLAPAQEDRTAASGKKSSRRQRASGSPVRSSSASSSTNPSAKGQSSCDVPTPEQSPLGDCMPAGSTAAGEHGEAPSPEAGCKERDLSGSSPVKALGDPQALSDITSDVVRRLMRPIVGEEVTVEVEVEDSKVRATVLASQDSGFLIGRDGQTLGAIQYIASRIVSKAMNGTVRIQLDAGEFRRHQDEKVCEMANALARKVISTGRTYSTRPLSSYHRRLVHLTLQEMPEIQTRSSGEGSLKRVVIMRRKAEKS